MTGKPADSPVAVSAGPRVVFMGSASFAVPSLDALFRAGYSIPLVVTRADKPSGRGLEMSRTPVAKVADSLGLPVYQPKTLRTPEVQEVIRQARCDVIVVAAYGRILPAEVLSIPPAGCVNVHGSILPKYRGAAPVQWAVVKGEAVTGVSIMSMDEGLDTGAVYLIRNTPIQRDDTAATVYERLTELGAEALLEAMPGILDGSLNAIPQDPEKATLAPILSKEDGLVDWNQPAESIRNMVRGMEPWPGAHTFTSTGLRLRVFPQVEREPGGDFQGPPGLVLSAARDGVLVRTGDGALVLGDLQPAGSRRMTARELVAGRRLVVGDLLGSCPGEGERNG